MKRLKEYKHERANTFIKNRLCPECERITEKREDDPNHHGWVLRFECVSCDIKYIYTPSDMGQTLQELIQVDKFPKFTKKP